MTQSHGMPRARLARALAVLAVVLGVLGMHGLSFHGTAHADAAEAGMVAHSALPDFRPAPARHASGDTGIDAASQSSSAETSPVVSAATPYSGGTEHTLRYMAMLCIATLVLAANLLAMMRCLRRVPRMWAVVHVAVSHSPYLCLTPRSTGPPHVWRFSVIRC